MLFDSSRNLGSHIQVTYWKIDETKVFDADQNSKKFVLQDSLKKKVTQVKPNKFEKVTKIWAKHLNAEKFRENMII